MFVIMIGSVACAEFEINEREEREILQYLENNFEISKEIPEGGLAYCFILDNHSPECQGGMVGKVSNALSRR